MASRCTVNPSPQSTSIRDLLFHFRESVSLGLLSGLEARDADWRAENEQYRFRICEINRFLEDERGNQRAEMDRIVDDFKRERGEFVSELRLVKSKKNSEIDRVLKEKRDLEAEVCELKRLNSVENRRCLDMGMDLEQEKKKSEGLLRRIAFLEKENADISRISNGRKAEIRKLETKKVKIQVLETEKRSEIERLLSEKTKLESDNRRLEKRISELVHKNDVLEKEKWAIETDFLETNAQKSTEIEKMLNETTALEDQIRVLETEKGEKNTEIEKIMKEKTDLVIEKRRSEKCLKEENSKLSHRIGVLESTKGALEVLDKEKNTEIKSIFNEQRALETENRRLEERIAELVHRNGVLEKGKGAIESVFQVTNIEKRTEIERMLDVRIALEDQICVLETEKGVMNTKIDKIVKEKTDLVIEKRRSEKCLKEENSELVHKIGVLEKSKRSLEAQVSKVEEENDWMKKRMDTVKKAFDDEKRKLEEEKNGKISKLVKSVDVLEKGMNDASDRIVEVNEALEAQKILTCELGHRNDVLEKEKGAIEADFRKTNVEKSNEIERMLNETVALEDQMRVLETEKDEMNTIIEKIMKEKTDLDIKKRRAEKCSKEENSKLVHKIEVLERSKKSLKAQVSKTVKEKNLIKRKMNYAKKAFEAKNRRLEEKSEKISELVKRAEVSEKDMNGTKVSKGSQRIGVLEKEGKELEAKLCQANNQLKKISNEKKALEARMRDVEEDGADKISELVKRIGLLKEEKKELEAKVSQAEKEKSEEIQRFLTEKGALEDEKRALKDEGTKKVSEMMKWTEEEKKEMEAKVCQANKEKSEEIRRILNEKIALQEHSSRMEKKMKKEIFELADQIRVFETVERKKDTEIERMKKDKTDLDMEKRRAEGCCKEEKSKLVQRIEVLERDKGALDAKVSKVEKEKNWIKDAKKSLEAEKRRLKEINVKISKLVKRTGDLEKQKAGLEAVVCKANKDKNFEKKILELVDRNEILEREKRGFEAEVVQRDDMIKLLEEDIDCLKDQEKELEMEINRLKEEVQLLQHLRLANDALTLSTPRQNEGQNFASMGHSSEHSGSSNNSVENSDGQYEDEFTRTNACKRKRSIGKWEEPGKKILKRACEPLSTNGILTGVDVVDVKPVLLLCQKNTKMNITRCTNGNNGGGVQVVSGKIACEWEFDQDLLTAFDVDSELCLKAICALYRQHQRLGDSTNITLTDDGIAYAQYLIGEDPEGRKTKKMVAKLDKFNQDAVGVCIGLAKQHYKQVFDIYKKKEDPVFLS